MTWNTHTNRQTTSNSGIQFSYPQTFSGNVWRPLNRPPMVNVVSLTQDPVAIGCPDMQNISEQTWIIQGKTNDGLSYSLYQGSDVGAGQLYTLYCYVIQGKDNYYVFDITIHSTNGCWWGNCGPYCGTEHEQECKDFDMTKDVAQPLNDIVATLKIDENLVPNNPPSITPPTQNPPSITPPTSNPPPKTPTNQKCALETCHGLDITCGPNPPDVCTDIYGMGDKCLKYVQCGIVNGTCQAIENTSFSQCKSCVENCINTNQGDTIKAFECESNCK
jgi:hypothetical protein